MGPATRDLSIREKAYLHVPSDHETDHETRLSKYQSHLTHKLPVTSSNGLVPCGKPRGTHDAATDT